MADIDLGFLCHDSKKSGDGQFAPPRVYLLFRTTHKASPAGPCRKQKPFSSSSGFFCRQLSQFPLQSAHQFVQTGHSQLIKLKQLEHPFGRSPTGIELQEHCRNQGQIKLIGRSLLAFGQPMPAAQQAFYPPEKQFDLPPPPIQQDHQCRWQFVGSQVWSAKSSDCPPPSPTTALGPWRCGFARWPQGVPKPAAQLRLGGPARSPAIAPPP